MLVHAVSIGARDLAAALLAAGIDPNALEGRPLAAAAGSGNTEMVRLLLAAGADPDQAGPRGLSPLAFAVIHRHDEAAEALLSAGADPDGKASSHPILFAVDPETVERLLEAGASVDARDAKGGTALMGAVMIGDEAMVELLIRHGADVNATDKAGRTALLYATVGQFREIEKRLLAANAEPLPGYEVAIGGLASFLGSYGRQGLTEFEILADTGQLVLVSRESDGMLYAHDLGPLSATRFFRRNDPGAMIFEMRVEEGRVIGLALMRATTWEFFPRIEKTPI
jgi:hypothetical protein